MIGYMQTRLTFVVTSGCRCLRLSLALHHVIQSVFPSSCPQEPSETFSSGVDGLVNDSSVQLVGDPCWNLLNSQTHSACSLTEPYTQQSQNVYENFMQELEMGDALQEWEEVEGEQAESSSGSLSSLEQMELLFEKEQGVVRRAGRLAFKPLISLHKERKLELVARRRWRQYWVTLKGKSSSVLSSRSDWNIIVTGPDWCNRKVFNLK